MNIKHVTAFTYDIDTYKPERAFTSVRGLKVRSFSKQLTEDERKVTRRQTTEDIVRILKAAGKL